MTFKFIRIENATLLLELWFKTIASTNRFHDSKKKRDQTFVFRILPAVNLIFHLLT